MSMYAMIETKSGAGKLPQELDPKNEGLMYGHALAEPAVFDNVNDVAKKLGAKSLHSFYYEDWDDFDDEELEEFRPKDQKEWHDPADGLRTVAALLEFFRKPDRSLLTELGIEEQSFEDVVWDLTAYESILNQAKVQRDPFRIVIY